MKRLFILSFLCCFSIGIQAQDIPKELLKTWLPILSQDFEGDTTYYSGLNLFTFEKGVGHLEFPIQNFQFEVVQDSLIFYRQSFGRASAKIIELRNDRLVLSLDSSLIVTYIPLPQIEQKRKLSDIEAIISDNIWSLRLPRSDGEFFDLKMKFFDHLQDSSVVYDEYLDLFKTVKLYNFSYDDDQVFWYVDKHQNSFVLHIHEVFGTSFGLKNLIIKDIKKGKMSLMYWSGGEELTAEAHKWKKKSVREQNKEIENLTRQAWRIQEEIIPPPLDTTGLMDLGMVIDDFEELEDEEYKKDSTLIISQQDIDNKSLILEFDKSGTYKIYRESRVLNEGKWTIQFNNTIIKLESKRKAQDGDGIVDGYIEILKVKKNQLILSRVFKNNLSYHIDTDYSYKEVYKPIR